MGVGYLAQEPSVFRKLTVEDNVMAILETLGLSRAERKTRLEELSGETEKKTEDLTMMAEVVSAVIEAGGYSMVRGDARHDVSVPTMRHGTGHGIGLEVHEPILLDQGGGEILANEIFTVEPGLYSATLGGVRVEDMVLATAGGHEILSPLHEGLNWKD